MRLRFPYILTTCLFGLSLACSAPEVRGPKLLVTIVVDQMRADHLTRFADLYKGGFARLLNDGAVFADARHDHAHTYTGVGHATISTGTFPSHHEIVGNDWFDRKENLKVYCCQDRNSPILGYPHLPKKKGRSPKLLKRSTFGDWLKAASPKSKVFGVARKDRAAILSTGADADGAYWYNEDDGKMVTSEYYTDKYPDWVRAFNEQRRVDAYFDSTWTKLLSEPGAYSAARPDSSVYENDGRHTTFPHAFRTGSGKPDAAYYKDFISTPFSDELTVEFAETLIDHEQVGSDDVTDFLFLGCSAADAIGHSFGPYSVESMDHFLRLDRYLGDFFVFLDKRIGRANYVVTLSSDHGVLPIPEELAKRGVAAERISSDQLKKEVSPLLNKVAEDLGIASPLVTYTINNELFINYEAANLNAVAPARFDSLLAAALQRAPQIDEVFSREVLLGGDGTNASPYLATFQHSYAPDRSGDLMLRLKKYCLARTSAFGTSHGSPYEYDAHIPLIFMGSGIKSGTVKQQVRSIDIAPTLAALIHISPVQPVDGRSLTPAILTAPEQKNVPQE